MDADSIAALVHDNNAAELAPSMRDPILSGSAVNQKGFSRHGEEMPHNALWASGDEEEDYPDFLDAENAPNNENNLGSGFIPIVARVSDDVDDDYEGDVEEVGSFSSTGSYDSVSERMGTASITDLASPVGLFVEPISLPEAASATHKGALRQLNELDSGFSSLDTSLLENTNEEGFRSRVMKIAKAKSVSPGDDVISNILSALLPMVGKMVKQSCAVGDETLPDAGDYTRIMPVAKPTVEDDDDIDGVDDVELGSSQADINEGASDVEQLEGDVLPGSAKGLRIRGVDDESKEEDSNLLQSLTGKSLFSSDQEETSFEVEQESGNLAKLANQIVVKSANADEKLQASVGEDIEPSGMEKNVESPNEHDLLISSNGSGLHPDSHSKDGASLQGTTESNSTGAQDEVLVGTPEEGKDCVEGDPLPESKGSAQEWHPEGENAITRLESEQVRESKALAADGLEEGVPSKSRSLDLPAFSYVQSIDAKDTDNQESETADNSHAADFDALKDKSDIICAKEGSLEAEPKKDVLEEREDTQERAFKADNDDDDNDDNVDKDDMADDSLPVGALVSSKSTADPASDTPSLGGAGPSLAVRPIGLGRSIPPLEHAPRAVQRSSGASAPAPSMEREDSGPNMEISEGNQDAREKLQGIRIKFLRLAHRLGQPPHNAVVAQVLYRLGLAEQLRGGQGAGRPRVFSSPGVFSSERASVLAEEQEAAEHDDLDFECTIMLLGKSGVGKSATINSLFDEIKAGTDAYSPATQKVQIVTGTVHGIKLRVIDTPGLLNSFADQRHNRRVMSSVRRFIKKCPPDIVLYFDRLDMQTRDYGDLPLLQTITDTFGAAVWFNAIVVFTHAASAPPDGANGVPINYEMFVAQRSHVVQQTIRQAAGDMRLMNPVSLVENHAACRTNRAGQRVLPNGQVWKSQLLLLCFASKILAEANSLLKLQDSNPGKPFGVRSRGPPLPYLLSSLLQSRAQLKLPGEQADDDEASDDDSEGEGADSDGEEEYDDLPPFRRLVRDELQLLDKDQRRAYFEELDYREKLFMKKQLKEERERRKELKRRLRTLPKEVSEYMEDRAAEEENATAAVPVAMPDMALPPSFDADNPSYRYRYLDSANQWLVRPVLETHGWDHDSGYDGLNVEKMFVISRKIPASISGQVTKDKKEANLQMECAASFRNGDGKVTLTGLDIQTIGKDLAYTIRSETRFDNFKRNKTTCGLSVTTLGDTIAAGMKLEDRLMVGKRVKVLVNGGALTGRGDVAYGGSLEASFRGKDYPIDRSFSTFGLSIMNWHGDLAIGGNLQLQVQLGKNLLTGRANLNNRGAGQINIRVNSSEQLQMALIGLVPLVRAFINNRILNSSEPAR